MTINATAGSTSANSFITLDEANAYHDARLHNLEWGTASEGDKEKAILQATRLLNNKSWVGNPNSLTQALKFPRYDIYTDDGVLMGSGIIPQFLKDATAEYAWLLIIGDTTRESGLKGIESAKVGPISITSDKTDRTGDIPGAVIDIIKPWLKSRGVLEVQRG